MECTGLRCCFAHPPKLLVISSNMVINLREAVFVLFPTHRLSRDQAKQILPSLHIMRQCITCMCMLKSIICSSLGIGPLLSVQDDA